MPVALTPTPLSADSLPEAQSGAAAATAAVTHGDAEEDADDGDVEITLELPRGKVDALVEQLSEDSALRRTWHLGHVASVEPAAEPLPGSPGSDPPVAAPAATAVAFDPVAKLARLRELQSQFGAVKERRQRMEAAARVLDSLPQPGSAQLKARPRPEETSYEQLAEGLAQGAKGVDDSDVGAHLVAPDAPAVFPPPEGLPFPHRGVPGVLQPTVAPPPEQEPDPTDASADLAWLAEVAAEGGVGGARAPPPPERCFQKRGLDMALDHFRADAARMAAELRERDRQLEESSILEEMKKLGAGPDLRKQLLQQQRVIHEQQRIAEELHRDKDIEEERLRCLERAQRTGEAVLPGGPSYSDARAMELGPGSPTYPAMRHLSPRPGKGTVADGLPHSYFPEDCPPSRQFQNELARQAGREGWPDASSLAASRPPAAGGGEAAAARPLRQKESPRPPAESTEVRRPSFAGQGFFAGFEPRDGAGADARAQGGPGDGGEQRGQTSAPFWAAFAGFDADEPADPHHERSQPRRHSRDDPRRPSQTGRSVTPPRRVSQHRRSSFNFGAVPGQVQVGGSSPSRRPVKNSFLGTVPSAVGPRAPRDSPPGSTAGSGSAEVDGDAAAAEEQTDFFASLFGRSAPAPKGPAIGRHVRKPPDPGERFMDGACLDPSPPLCPPDPQATVEEAYEQILSARQAGLLGERDIAQTVLDYVAAVAGNAEALAKGGEVPSHVRMVTDTLTFYPKCVQIHLWGLEALMALFRHESWDRAEGLARPIFDVVSDLMETHEKDPSLHAAVPELPKRMLAALALVLTPSTIARLKSSHVDFVLRVIQGLEAGPLLTEHGLHVLLDARSPHRLLEQAHAARDALRSFRAEPRLVPRALLALRETCLVSAETPSGAPEDPEPGSRRFPDLTEPAPSSGVSHAHERVPLGLREITTVMDLYAQDRKIQGAGAMALAAAVNVPGISLAAAARVGAVRAIVLAQQRFSSSRSVALQFCKVVAAVALREPQLLSAEATPDVVRVGLAFPRDGEIAVAALEAVHSLAGRLRELASGPDERLELASKDLVRLGERCHVDPYALGLLMVVLVVAASGGSGTTPGGVAGERWRSAFGRAAAVVLPLRALYEHAGDPELVCASAVALRCLTYGSAASCAHAGRVKAASVLLGTLSRYVGHPDISRELLAALGNCASDAAVFQEFQDSCSQNVQNALYEAAERCSRHEPDVLAQGCRALAALGAVPDMERLNAAMLSASVGVSDRAGEEVEQHFLSLFGRVQLSEEVLKRRERLAELCSGLLHPDRAQRLAAGPHFGRLVDAQGEPTPECLAHRRSSTRRSADAGGHSARRSVSARRSSSRRPVAGVAA